MRGLRASGAVKGDAGMPGTGIKLFKAISPSRLLDAEYVPGVGAARKVGGRGGRRRGGRDSRVDDSTGFKSPCRPGDAETRTTDHAGRGTRRRCARARARADKRAALRARARARVRAREGARHDGHIVTERECADSRIGL